LGLEGRRRSRLAQSYRHQESGGRHADQRSDLRQEPRRSRGCDQGARPRAAVEPLRRSAMDLWQAARRALGSLLAAARAPEIRRGGVPDRLVVGRREGGQGRNAVKTRREVLVLAAGALSAIGLPRWLAGPAIAAEVERHGMSAFGDLN